MKPFPFVLLVLGACAVGEDREIDGGPGGTPEERLCTTEFALTGTFTLGGSPPDTVNNETGKAPGDGIPDIQGCWPTGTWSFSLAQMTNDCDPAPAPPATISFRVDFVADSVDPAYKPVLVSPSVDKSALRRLHVSEGGGGKCEGNVELFSQDGLDAYNLHPTLDVFNQNGSLVGVGEFGHFSANQLPTKCGDGLIQDHEECDDGNDVNGDGCPADCGVQ